MSGSRAAAGAGPSSSGGIPSNARKVVMQLKEVVPGTDDEIYAMLRDCNMDPNETVQRLLNQDPFHEVKRRRDKKKDGVGSKDTTENRPRPANGGPSSRGGRSGSMDRGAGRGNGGSRYSNDYNSGERGKQFVPRENGIHQNSRGSSGAALGASPTNSSYGQQRALSSLPASASAPIASPVSGAVLAPASVSTPPPAAVPAAAPGPVASSSITNGSSLYVRSSPAAQGTWGAGSGHATMADIVKSNGVPPPAPSSLQPSLPSVSQQYVPAPTVGSASGVYSSATDPVLHPALDPRAAGAPGAIKRELGSVGNQRPIGDRPSVSIVVEGNSVSSPSHQAHLPGISATSSGGLHSLESEMQVPTPGSPSATAVAQERANSLQSGASDSVNTVGPGLRQPTSSAVNSVSVTPAPRTVLGGQFSRSGYQGQQQPVGPQKPSGSGLEWKPKPSVSVLGGLTTSLVTPPSSVAAPEPTRVTPATTTQESTAVVSVVTAKLQGLNVQDEQQVIIPNHLQVTEADRTRLNFGSFGEGFGTSYSSSFVAEEPSKMSLPVMETAPLVEPPVEQPSTSSMPAPLSQVYGHQVVSSPLETLVSSSDVPISAPTPAAPQLELSKPDPMVQQGQYPYLPNVASYPGFGLVPHMPSQYPYEPADPQPPDVSRLPNLMAYSDPTTSYYAPFRPGTDPDTRYPPFLTSNVTSKFNGNIGLQSLQSSQEGGNSLAASGPSVQTSQTGNAQSPPVMPQQQPLPMHPYQPAGVPLGFASVFGYQYGPSNYAYMHHPPYQHSYTANSGYPQGPTGTGYPQAGGSSYAPAGAGTVKYPVPQQYKPGSASGNVPHSAAASGYGGYAATPAGYAGNPSVSAGSAAGYEDVPGQPYKDSNLYIPNQQGEGSTVWIQTQLSRDMANAAGMQTSSYYSIPTQAQHTGYAHTQQPAHAHAHPAAYASLYHPSQSGPAPLAHQLLQQPGAGAAGGGQAGAYPQPQRTQPTWANNY